MQVVFFGTPPFAVPSLKRLVASKHRVQAVVTQPDRPGGRGLSPRPPAVKLAAESLGLPIWQPERLDRAWVDRVLALEVEAAVVVAFGQKIPSPLLTGFEHGCINLHPSLLPRYRGAAPIQRAIMDGCTLTGVTTIYLDEGWDSGDIILQKEVPITPDDTGQTLHDRLADVGAALLEETLDAVARKEASRIPQDDRLASYAERIETADAHIDWTKPAAVIYDLVRALNPQPGAWTTHNGAMMKILRARVGKEEGNVQLEPGTILRSGKEGILVQSGDATTLLVESIQPAGKKVMSVEAYLCGHSLMPGEIFR